MLPIGWDEIKNNLKTSSILVFVEQIVILNVRVWAAKIELVSGNRKPIP